MLHPCFSKRLFPACSLIAGVFFMVGCQTHENYERAERGDTTTTISVPDAVPADDARAVVVKSLVRRGWEVEDPSSEIINAKLYHRDIEAELEIEVNSDEIVMESDSQDVEGVPLVPVRWMNYLEKDINERLAMAAVSD
ncbi:MAG: hypothetical protein ACLFUF_05255 [Opitutales bacterium]